MNIYLTYDDLYKRAASLPLSGKCIYGIPNGGIQAALIAHARHPSSTIVDCPSQADCFVDDIIDSGATRTKWLDLYKHRTNEFYALVDKKGKDEQWQGQWVSFPWENAKGQSGIEDNIRRILQYIGEDPNREGLKETPARVARSYKELFEGYEKKPEDVFKCFTEKDYDEIVLLKDITFCSTCEHHCQVFSGHAHIAYIPAGRVIGVSKLARLLDIFAYRLQIQERITVQVTDALETYLKPKGAACILEATHNCMVCRGVKKPHAVMVTSSLTGVFKREPSARSELMQLIRG
jgi:GTP cyclohydrolase IA